MSSIIVLAIPHCASRYNDEKRLQGQLDIGLSNGGRKDAAALADLLAPVTLDGIYSSDLLRCSETARAIASTHSLSPSFHSALRGRHYGILQGWLYEDIRTALPAYYAALKQRDLDVRFAGPGVVGESLFEFHTRAVGAVMDCLTAHLRSTSTVQTIAIVMHGGVLDAICRHTRGLAIEQVVKGRLYHPLLNVFTVEGGKLQEKRIK